MRKGCCIGLIANGLFNLVGDHVFWGSFVYYTAVEWYKLIYDEDLTISTNLFGSTFYSLVGLHLPATLSSV